MNPFGLSRQVPFVFLKLLVFSIPFVPLRVVLFPLLKVIRSLELVTSLILRPTTTFKAHRLVGLTR